MLLLLLHAPATNLGDAVCPEIQAANVVDIAVLLLHASRKLSQPCYGLPFVKKRQRIGQQTIPAAAEAALMLSSRRGYAFDTPALLLPGQTPIRCFEWQQQ